MDGHVHAREGSRRHPIGSRGPEMGRGVDGTGGAERDEGAEDESAQHSLHESLQASQTNWGAGGAETVAAHLPKIAHALRPVLRQRGLSEEEAADVIQEVLARAWANRERFRSARGLYRWSYVVARNVTTTLLRQRARLSDADVPDGAVPDAAELAQQRQEVEALFEAFRRLSTQDQRAISDALRLSITDDARSPAGRKRLERARARLRELMRRGWVGAPPAIRLRQEALLGTLAATGAGLSLVFGASVSQAPMPTELKAGLPRQLGMSSVVVFPRALGSTDETGGAPTRFDRNAQPRQTGTHGDHPPKPRPPSWTIDIPWSGDHQRIDTRQAPTVVGVEAETREKRADDRMACLENVPVIQGACVDHIVR